MFIFKKATFASCLFLASAVAIASPIDLYYYHQLEQQQARSLTNPLANTRVEYYPQLIDHQHPKLGTFLQRYYINETYGTTNDAPVFLYICGEMACNPAMLDMAMKTAAEKYHAKLIALEHRYYGKSLPTKSLSTKELRFLSTSDALQDIERFQKEISAQHKWTGKWVAFGGSYTGSLAAYYRMKFPNNVVGALASSAPVQAKENFEEYDAHVTKVAGPVCAEKMRAAYREIEASMSDPQKLAVIKHKFKVDNLKDTQDLLLLVAEVGGFAVQYSYKDSLCRMLEHSSSPLSTLAFVANQLYAAFKVEDPIMLTPQGSESENPAAYGDVFGMRQWYYQSCKEYGYWQPAYKDSAQSTRSPLLNLEYFHHICERLFGLKTPAQVEQMNEQYYSQLLEPTTTNIFLTNGTDDPWSRLSLTEENQNNTNKNLTYYTIADAAHCEDLHAAKESDSASLKETRTMLSGLLAQWLGSQNQIK